MKAREANPLFHELPDDLEMIALDNRMSAAAIHEENERVSPGKRLGVFGPAVEVDRGNHPGNLVEAFFQKQDPGIEFVFTRSMAGSPGNEDDFFPGPALRRGRRWVEGAGKEAEA